MALVIHKRKEVKVVSFIKTTKENQLVTKSLIGWKIKTWLNTYVACSMTF